MKLLLALATIVSICATAAAGDFQIFSSAFSNGDPIPEKFSRLGENTPPPLDWSNPPNGISSFALVMDDPDSPSGAWTHWMLANIPQNLSGLRCTTRHLRITHYASAEDSVSTEPPFTPVPQGCVQGRNSWGRDAYDGPQPPSGTHRYFFRLYALDTTLPLKNDFSGAELEAAMKGHVIGKAEIMGIYSARN